jgi:heptosyltransferase I
MKVLIVRVGAMGDVLHALPAVAALREARPDWEIGWVVDPRWAPMLVDGQGHGPVVSRVHLAETKLWTKSPVSFATLRSIGALRKALRRGRSDLVVDMQGTLRSAVIGWMAGAREFVGYRDPREGLAAKFYSRTVGRRGVHVVEQGVALLGEACGMSLEPGAVDLPHEQWADAWAEELVGGRNLVLLAAGAGWGAKRWPAQKFGALAKELRVLGLTAVVNAPRADDALAAEVVARSDGASEVVVCNVAGLIALMRRVSVLVGGDSGPMHLAAALGIPLVALFGPTDPARNGPWGAGQQVVIRDPGSMTSYKRVEVDAGLAGVSVSEVVDAVRRVV